MTQEIFLESNTDYLKFLGDVKSHIQHSRLKAALAVNSELLTFYWRLGCMILERQRDMKWGDKLISVLARDLKAAYPDSKGFSPTNLNYMRMFAEIYPDFQLSEAVPRQLPWTHQVLLMKRIKCPNERIWYNTKAIEEGWSSRKLINEMEKGAYQRQASLEHKTTNFKSCLPAAQSQLALETIKDPYKFDFLTIGQDALV